MFQAFQSDPRSQIQGFFDFVRAKGAIEAIRNQDFFEFAKIYNGLGQAAEYERIIRNRLALFQSVRPVAPALPAMAALAPAALPAFEAAAPAEVAAERLVDWQQQLLFVTQLSIIQQTYWLRLAAATDPATAQQVMIDATNEAIRQLAALRSQR
jgi:hypothetical protein